MKQILIKQGHAVVEEVPSPLPEPGSILVQVDHSCISIGTEMSSIKTSGLPLWKRAIREPQNVKKVLEMVASRGFGPARSLVKGALSAGSPTGYSAAGVILEVGTGIDDLRPGERVACAGAQCAYHAEIIRVPRNLSVPVPEDVDFAAASTVTLGAIALQGVRRAKPTLGETFVVIGLGVLGQLTTQILRANGCRVIGTDLDEERVHLAQELGLHWGIYAEEGNDIEHVMRLTNSIGADGVIITAATSSDKIVSTAFNMCRKKGRVVLVGDVSLNLKRADFYEKELDFFISTSYGPGRYDPVYEEEGMDYPVAYVRWTENRNMAEYLRLLSEGKLCVERMIGQIYPIEHAQEAYEALKQKSQKPLIVLLSYKQEETGTEPKVFVPNPEAKPATEGRIRIAIVGAGDFAKGIHLPNLQSLSDRYHIQAIISRTGHNARAAAKQFGANYAGTDCQALLDDPEVDAVLITTRHNLHADMVLQALKAGKHVLVEKPLCLNRQELNVIISFYRINHDSNQRINESTNQPILMTGFNRRFSRFARRIKEIVTGRTNPMIINYRMNAGYIPLDHWVHSEEGGGRNIGEACHIYDLFTFFTESKVESVDVKAIHPTTGYYSHSDNFVATISFEDGSVASLTYTALGSNEYPKEQMEIFMDGKVFAIDDYKRLVVFGSKEKRFESKIVDKGHKDELEAFSMAIQKGGEWPILLWQQVQATEIALKVEELIRSEC